MPSKDSSQKRMSADDFRRLALAMPEASEGAHHGNPDFRVAKKIFATLAFEDEGFGVVLISRTEQTSLITAEPEVFSAVPGGWGRQGATRVLLARVTEKMLTAALELAWRKRAPKRLAPT